MGQFIRFKEEEIGSIQGLDCCLASRVSASECVSNTGLEIFFGESVQSYSSKTVQFSLALTVDSYIEDIAKKNT